MQRRLVLVGREISSDEDYVALFRYTIDYLFGECKIDNFAVAYSPNGPITDKKEYLSRYPGDDIVDILGIDYIMTHRTKAMRSAASFRRQWI